MKTLMQRFAALAESLDEAIDGCATFRLDGRSYVFEPARVRQAALAPVPPRRCNERAGQPPAMHPDQFLSFENQMARDDSPINRLVAAVPADGSAPSPPQKPDKGECQ